MARIITKGLIGLQDLSLGNGTFTRSTSTGGIQTLDQINSGNIGGGGGTFPSNSNSPVAPTGVINGINTVFTLPSSPGTVVLIFLNGLLQNPGALNDYTLSGSTVTFNIAPAINDVVLAVY